MNSSTKQIYYIANYIDCKTKRDVTTQPSAITKINYVKSALKTAGYNVYMYSIAEGSAESKVNIPYTQVVDSQETIYYPAIIRRSNIFLKIVSRILLYIQLLYFFIFRLRSEDAVLIYHTLQICSIVKFIQKFWDRKIYFEVEEIYNACYNNGSQKINKEISYLQNSSGYILVNDIIKYKCGFNQSSVTCYGPYIYNQYNLPYDTVPSKINLIYAGLIGKFGSDAYLATDIAQYLPQNYHIYILGYGSAKDIQNLKKYIFNNQKKGTCTVSYEGCLFGEDYVRFLSKCDIGLCTRVLDDGLSDYTFPSKVLVYMSNNIIPVCTPLTCIKESSIGGFVSFTKSCDAKEISSTILGVDLSLKAKYQEVIKTLDFNFINGLQKLL